MSYSYSVAKEVLSENDKNRLMCLYLHCNHSDINWEKATQEFGCASVVSMKVMTRNALKKIQEAGGREGYDVGNVAASKTPKLTGKKRKAKDEDDGSGKTLARRKRGRKPKKADTPVSDDNDMEESKKAGK